MASNSKLGCPVANRDIPCRGCGGNWPGTHIRHKDMLRVLQEGRVRPEAMKCGTLKEQVINFYREVKYGTQPSDVCQKVSG